MQIITVRWMDATAGATAGWHAELAEGGRVVSDSEKVSFLVDVDEYEHDELPELLAALVEAYPDAEIVTE